MERVVLNPYKLKDSEVVEKSKVRLLIFDNNNNVLICNYNGIYMLPGGKIELGEKVIDALLRELNEELGYDFAGEDITPLVEFVYYQKDFPSIDDLSSDRKVTTYYFTSRVNIDLDNTRQKLSENEKKNNFNVFYYPFEKLEKLILENNTDNPRNDFFAKELLSVVYLVNQPSNLNVRIKRL